MKFLSYLESLFFPRKMIQRKNMNVVVALLILFLASFFVMIPYVSVFLRNPYDAILGNRNFELGIFTKSLSHEVDFTEDEVKSFKDMDITPLKFKELKAFSFSIEDGIYVKDDDIAYSDIPYNHKEYVLKREAGDEGTYYIHIVFDLFDDLSDATSNENIKHFDELIKLKKRGTENRYLLCFYKDSYIHRTKYDVKKNYHATADDYSELKGLKTRNVSFNFSDFNDLEDLGRLLARMFGPNIVMQYTFLGFIYTFLLPFLFSLVGLLFLGSGSLKSFRNLLSMAALTTLTVAPIFFILGWIKYFNSRGHVAYYVLAFGIYYLIILRIANRQEGY